MIFADNCEVETIVELNKQYPSIEIIETKLGNSNSWRYAASFAKDKFLQKDIIYFVEDDYFHPRGSPSLIREGMEVGDYLSLYDYPDKYQDFTDGGSNPFVKDGGETTKVLLTASRHWKLTNSTTMTFATRVKTLEDDWQIWESGD